MIETAIRSLLLADATVSGLVGTRVYPGVMPQRPTLPLITLTKADKVPATLTLDEVRGINALRVQVDCWAQDTADGEAGVDKVRELADAVNGSDDQASAGALHGFAGLSEGLRIKLLELVVERATEFEPDTRLYRVSADYRAHL